MRVRGVAYNCFHMCAAVVVVAAAVPAAAAVVVVGVIVYAVRSSMCYNNNYYVKGSTGCCCWITMESGCASTDPDNRWLSNGQCVVLLMHTGPLNCIEMLRPSICFTGSVTTKGNCGS